MNPIVQIFTTKLNQTLDRVCLRLLPDRRPTVHDLNSTFHDNIRTPSRQQNKYLFDNSNQFTIFTRLVRPNQLFHDLSLISTRPDRPDRIWVVGIIGNWSGMHNFIIKTSENFIHGRFGVGITCYPCPSVRMCVRPNKISFRSLI